MTDHNLQHSIDELIRVERKILRTQQWWYSIIHGIMVGIGGTVGVALVVTVLLSILNRLVSVTGDDSWIETLRLILQSATSR